MKRWMLTAVALAVSGMALAKLPAPQLDDAAKAKAAEAAAKSACQAKLDAFQLCKAQDRVAEAYKKTAASKPPAAPAASPGGAAPSPATASVAAALPPCGDPGPFVYAPPDQKPLEAAGAHSPTTTAASPPSGRANSAELAPAKSGTASPAPAATGAATPAKK